MSDAPHTPPSPDTAEPSSDTVVRADPDATSPADVDAVEPVDLDPVEPVDLDAVEHDLAAVERALERLSDGTYWTDEVTGEPIPDHVLAADPTARQA